MSAAGWAAPVTAAAGAAAAGDDKSAAGWRTALALHSCFRVLFSVEGVCLHPGCRHVPWQHNCFHRQAAHVVLLSTCCCRRVTYHGPIAEVQQHFQSVGFDLPPRIDVPSWLVEITTPSGGATSDFVQGLVQGLGAFTAAPCCCSDRQRLVLQADAAHALRCRQLHVSRTRL